MATRWLPRIDAYAIASTRLVLPCPLRPTKAVTTELREIAFNDRGPDVPFFCGFLPRLYCTQLLVERYDAHGVEAANAADAAIAPERDRAAVPRHTFDVRVNARFAAPGTAAARDARSAPRTLPFDAVEHFAQAPGRNRTQPAPLGTDPLFGMHGITP